MQCARESMSTFLGLIILAIVAVAGNLIKHERNEVLRVHNEIRQSIMNWEYEQFPPVRGQLPQLTWNSTLETMANIRARYSISQYFDNRLIKEFIFAQSTYIFKNVEEFQNFNFVLKEFVRTFDPLAPVNPKSYSAARKVSM
ncbi:hypothetical protein EG68_03049 [Paragonimus skrjabini miyazakii]|uniref:Uncharacterized protein n=1 Tax=Paragonimus skrjabini miyazakii TaxID=59628 RepID=A0A8S9YWH9_9TREM|nr:hypothetical protein EG68_03049 [Paragonimus skrjabini miyazakii]